MQEPSTGSAATCSCCLPRRGVCAGLAAAAAANVFTPRRAYADMAAQTSNRLTPQQAIDRLMAGNLRYRTRQPLVCSTDLAARRQATASQQAPFAAILSCADSRVPVDLVFDQTLGDLFVTRVAGNVTSPDIIASMEYGVVALGTRAIMVLGHEKCGAVKAAIDGQPQPGQISTLFSALQPAIDTAGKDLTKAIQANATIQAALLRQSSPVLADLVRQNRLTIVPAYYALLSGAVTIL